MYLSAVLALKRTVQESKMEGDTGGFLFFVILSAIAAFSIYLWKKKK
jgi:hypothetical protein